MSAEKLAMVDEAAQAERAAKAQPHVDINGLVHPCPASQPELFVVPVRYALAHEKSEHVCCVPAIAPESRPMAARRLRAGFVYLWQHQGPLKRFAVSPQGLLQEQALDAAATPILDATLTGLALQKIHDAWMLYSEFPLNAEHCQSLSDSSAKRSQHMRHIALRTVADELQAPHCPPLQKADEVMAELLPDSYARSMKADQQKNAEDTDALGAMLLANPTPTNIKAYTDARHRIRERHKVLDQYPDASDEPPGEWSAEPWDGQGTRDWLENAKAQREGLFAVFACLDDDLGVLRDINHEQEWLETGHEKWLGENNLRLSIGGFVRSLISEDGAELAGNLSYRYKDRDISLTPEQGQIMLDTQDRLNEVLRVETRDRQFGGRPTQAEAAARDARIAAIVGPVRAFIPADLYYEAEAVVREYRAQKHANLNSHAFSAKVGEYIDLDAMNTWFTDTAAAHYQQLEQRHTALFADRGVYLKRSVSGTWFVDYDDLETRQWLTELATGCLTAQCIRAQGAEQYADYVRTADGGALRQLFHAWTPSLEAAVNNASRLGELMAALSADNLSATHQALAPLSVAVLDHIASMARDAGSQWSVLVNRLGAALLLLKGDKGFSASWMSIFLAARLGGESRLQFVTEGVRPAWKLLGQRAEALDEWVSKTGKAIGVGRVERIVNSPVVVNSGGVVPLAALLLNVVNVQNYLREAGVLEGMEARRVNETVSASLYGAAALVAVVDSQVRMGLGVKEFGRGRSIAPTLTLFGGVIGGLSAGAAYQEFRSLQKRFENSQSQTDPWLQMRQIAVGGQVTAFSAQAILGASYTMRALAGSITAEVAILRYTLYMGPLNWIIAGLGLLYLTAWIFEKTPLQNFLNNCCWSKARANDLEPIAPKAQQDELDRLYLILYTPRVTMQSSSDPAPDNGRSGLAFVSAINSLTIDLPGAEPDSVYLELSMVGDPVDTQGYRHLIKNSPTNGYKAPRPWRDMTPHWLASSRCEWIPCKEGQGLRLSGAFNKLSNVLGTPPSTVSLRLRYRTPLTAILGARSFIGGERGLAFTLNDSTGVIALRNDPTPEIDRVPNYPLGEDHPGATYLQPKDKR
ncbi:toxin VasX [Pseudomonas monsensis]|uniref:toxin VasX n=1 Tax=Pseudomonas monsensis TaxID=2745509 RepID=UPI002ABC8083|nr:toxin VasX [Pseudomonas monsensis]MDZ3827232.1 toxin VasX [Pseudomonas monsensis]